MAANVQRSSAAPTKQSGPTTWTVLVGAEAEVQQTDKGAVGAWQFMRFYPDNLTINEGDTIDFKLNSAEFHNVMLFAPGQQPPQSIIPEGGGSHRMLANAATFLPQGGNSYDGSATVGSGQMVRGPQGLQDYKLTFPKAGSYQYLCSIHSGVNPANGQIMGMVGKLTVQAAGSAYPQTQQQIDAAAQAAIQADAAEAAKSDAEAQKVATHPGPNGSTIYSVNMGYTAMNGMADWMRFSQPDIQIHQGDTIEWMQKAAMAPHTVTFVSGGKEPDFIQPEPQPAGPPKLVINPQVALPAGGKTYSGSGYFNSGIIEGTMNPAPGSRTYSLIFAKPGRYEYICVIHDQEGMSGYVTVLAAQTSGGQSSGSQPMMPQTGSGTLDNVGTWGLIAGTFTLAGGLLLLALRLRQRRPTTSR